MVQKLEFFLSCNPCSLITRVRCLIIAFPIVRQWNIIFNYHNSALAYMMCWSALVFTQLIFYYDKDTKSLGKLIYKSAHLNMWKMWALLDDIEWFHSFSSLPAAIHRRITDFIAFNYRDTSSPLDLPYFPLLFTQSLCRCAKQCMQLSFFLFYNWGIESFLLMCRRACCICCRCCWKPGPVASPLKPLFLWLNSLERLFVCSFVSVWGCGCALCLCVCLLYIGQLSDLDLRAPYIAFNTTPLNCCAKCSH